MRRTIQEFKKCLEECVDLMIGIESITSDEVYAETEYSKCNLRCLKEFLQSIDIDELTDEEIDQIESIIRNEFT